MTKLSLACGLALSAALAACASTPHSNAATTTAAPAAGTSVAAASTKPPKLICEDSTQMGSHFKQRICLTPEQVEQRRKEAQQAAFDFQNRPQPVNSQGSGTPPI